MTSPLDALELSVDHLHAIIEAMSESQYVASAYPTEWTVADVMSHLGSAADHLQARHRRLPRRTRDAAGVQPVRVGRVERQDAARPGHRRPRRRPSPRSPGCIEMTPEERGRYALNLGPMTFDFDARRATATRRARLAHLGHRRVRSTSTRRCSPRPCPFMFDNLELLVRFSRQAHRERTHVAHPNDRSPARSSR